VNPDQFVLEFAAQVLDVFFPLEMCEELIEQEELRIVSGYGVATCCESRVPTN
jgi:hypothetical protein